MLFAIVLFFPFSFRWRGLVAWFSRLCPPLPFGPLNALLLLFGLNVKVALDSQFSVYDSPFYSPLLL